MSDGIVGRAYVELLPIVGAGFKEATDAELVGVGSSVEESAGKEGAVAGAALAGGVTKGLAKEAPKVENTAKGIASKIGNILESIGAKGGAVGIPFAVGLEKSGAKLKDADAAGQGLDATLLALGKSTLILGGVLGVAIGAESLKNFAALQQAEYQIAATSDISITKAGKIGDAFQSTAFKTYENSTAIATAFAGVSGQLSTVQGKALGAKGALAEMNVALDLNEAIGGDLTTTTAALATVQQTFGIKTKDASTASDILFNTSRLTNVGVDTLAQTFARLHLRLGEGTNSLKDIGALLVELGTKGAQGAAGTRILASGLTRLLGGTKSVDQSLGALASGTSITTLQSKLSTINAEISGAGVSSTSATNPIKERIDAIKAEIAGLGGASKTSNPLHGYYETLKSEESGLQAQLAQSTIAREGATTGLKEQKAAIEAQIASFQKLGAGQLYVNGNFIGMKAAITLLHGEFSKLTAQQQTQAATAIFGAQAAQPFLKLILAGPAAYEAHTAAVSKNNSASQAAAKNNDTLTRQFEVLRSGLHDMSTALGKDLLPYVKDAVRDLTDLASFVTKNHKEFAILAETVGGILTLAVGRFVAGKGADFLRFLNILPSKAQTAGKGVSKELGNLSSDASTQSGKIQSSLEQPFKNQATTAAVQTGKVEAQLDAQKLAALETDTTMTTRLEAPFVAETLAASGATAKVEGDFEAQRLAAAETDATIAGGGAAAFGGAAAAAGSGGLIARLFGAGKLPEGFAGIEGAGAGLGSVALPALIAAFTGYQIGQAIESSSWGKTITKSAQNLTGANTFGNQAGLTQQSQLQLQQQLSHLLDIKTQTAAMVVQEKIIASELGINTKAQAIAATKPGAEFPFITQGGGKADAAFAGGNLIRAVGSKGLPDRGPTTNIHIHPPAGAEPKQIATHVANRLAWRGRI